MVHKQEGLHAVFAQGENLPSTFSRELRTQYTPTSSVKYDFNIFWEGHVPTSRPNGTVLHYYCAITLH